MLTSHWLTLSNTDIWLVQPDLDELIKALGGGGPGGPPPPPPGRAPPQLPLELAMWGPTGSSVAYVFGANIYYR